MTAERRQEIQEEIRELKNHELVARRCNLLGMAVALRSRWIVLSGLLHNKKVQGEVK